MLTYADDLSLSLSDLRFGICFCAVASIQQDGGTVSQHQLQRSGM